MSKFLYLGMSLNEVVKASTTKPSEVLGIQNEKGTLKIDAGADLTLFKLHRGKHTLFDVDGEGRISQQKMKVTNVIKKGEIIV